MSRASAIWKGIKYALREAGYAIPAAYAFIEDQLDGNDEGAAPLEWRRFHVLGTQKSPAGYQDDLAGFKLDIVNYTAGEYDETWTTDDYVTVHNALYALHTAIRSLISSTWTLDKIVAYAMRYNTVPDTTRPFALTGPPVATFPHSSENLAGTGAVIHAAQVAMSITFVTPFPGHWGRAYLPHFGKALTADGRFASADVEVASDAFTTCFDTLAAADFFPVVPMGQLNKAPFHAHQGVLDVQVDDVPDIIRRRRPKRAAVRSHSDPL